MPERKRVAPIVSRKLTAPQNVSAIVKIERDVSIKNNASSAVKKKRKKFDNDAMKKSSNYDELYKMIIRLQDEVYLLSERIDKLK